MGPLGGALWVPLGGPLGGALGRCAALCCTVRCFSSFFLMVHISTVGRCGESSGRPWSGGAEQTAPISGIPPRTRFRPLFGLLRAPLSSVRAPSPLLLIFTLPHTPACADTIPVATMAEAPQQAQQQTGGAPSQQPSVFEVTAVSSSSFMFICAFIRASMYLCVWLVPDHASFVFGDGHLSVQDVCLPSQGRP